MDTKRLARSFTLVAATLGLTGCTQDSADNAVRSHGFTDITTEHSFVTGMLKCGEREGLFSYDFTAKNPKGQMVSGYVCQGPLKGSTVRF